MSAIEEEARRMAEEEQPEYLIPPVDKVKIITSFLVSQLGFDEEGAREALESERKAFLKLWTSKNTKILTTRSAHVRQLFTELFYPEFEPDKYVRGYDIHNPKERQEPSYAGPGKPVTKTW